MSEWARDSFYLSPESSYIQGDWEPYAYQVAIMDCISNDDIRVVDVMKSARIGYTKIVVAAIGYFAEHRRRNQVIWQPVDEDAEDFVKDEIDPMLRDCVVVQQVFPYYNTKSKYNTLRKKVFRGSTLDIRGGKAAKNYRRLSKDVAYYDELDAFDRDIEREGSALKLGDKRIEGATFPKSVRGSTPKTKGSSLIEASHDAADQRFKYFVPCPHCSHRQPLRWGGPEAPFGMKWVDENPATAAYLCEGCRELFGYDDYLSHCLPRGRWISQDGIWIDPEGYFRAENGEIVPAPAHVAFHIWTAYSPMVAWSKLVDEFIKARKDKNELKTFVNTTLGETWEEDESERSDVDDLMARREHYSAEVPLGVCAIVAGVDTHDDRFEIQFDGYGAGEERWSLSYVRLFGDPSRGLIWDKLAEALRKTFAREDGVQLGVMLVAQDHGGHYSDEVNAFSRRMGVRWLIPIRGSPSSGRPVAVMPRKRNAKGVYLTEIGTDTAKSLLYQRYQIEQHGPGYVHWPVSEEFDRTYFEQVTAEERVKRYRKGHAEYVWEDKGRRNEATDCSVYSLAAIRMLQQHFGLKLFDPRGDAPAPKNPPPARGNRSSGVSVF